MLDIDKWQEILSTIRRHKLRTGLTAFGIFWGVFMLVLLMAAGKGLQNGVEYQFRDDAVNSLWVWPGKASIPHQGLPINRETRLTTLDYQTIRQKVEGAEYISARYGLMGEFTVTDGKKSASYGVRSVHPEYVHIEHVLVRQGRFINDPDIREQRKVACIGKPVAENFFGPDMHKAIGQRLIIKGVNYQIVGVFEDEGGEREMLVIYLPVSTLQAVNSAKGRVHQVMLTMGQVDVAQSKVIEQDLRNELAALHQVSPDDKEAFYIRNNVEQFQQIQNLFLGIRAFVWIVALGTLVAGVVGVSNIMLITVKERTREIGIRKALGATPFSIVSLILQESIFITAVAGYLGLLTGAGLIHGVKVMMGPVEPDSFFRNPEVDFQVAIAAIVLLVVFGALAGLLPAWRAAYISPVEAMRE